MELCKKIKIYIPCLTFIILFSCTDQSKGMLINSDFGVVEMVNSSSICEFEEDELGVHIEKIADAIKDRKLPKLKTIFSIDHKFVKNNSDKQGLKVSYPNEDQLYIPLVEPKDWLLYYSKATVVAFEYRSEYHIHCSKK